MITDRKTTIGYYCPYCGSSVLNRIDIFSMSNNMLKLKCICEESELVIQITKEKKMRITIPCIICPVSHSFMVSSTTFFEKDLFYFTCTFTAVGICFFGESGKVATAMKKNEEELIKMFMAYDEYEVDDNNDINYAYAPKDADGFKAVKIGGKDETMQDNDGQVTKPQEISRDAFFLDDDLEFDDDWLEDDLYFDDIDVDDIFNKAIKGNMYAHDGSEIEDIFSEWDIQPPFEVYKSPEANNADTTKDNANNKTNSGQVDFDKLRIKSPPIFEQILAMIYILIEEERIFCECNDEAESCIDFISLAIQEDKIIVECKNCGAKREIKAVSSADLEYFSDIEVLYLD